MLKRSSHPSTRGLVRILTIASLIALLIVLAGEHHSAPVRAGFQVIGDVPRTGILHVLSIGINAYPKDSNIMNLHFAVADAQGVADAFSTKDVGNAFIKVDVKTLFDSDATVSGIRSALEHLIEVCKPEDVVIFYFAGMGARQKTNPETRTTSKASPITISSPSIVQSLLVVTFQPPVTLLPHTSSACSSFPFRRSGKSSSLTVQTPRLRLIH